MYHEGNIDQLLEATAYDRNGEKIGNVSGVYLDDQTSEPMWVTVNTGLFGLRTSFAPLTGSSLQGGELKLAHDKDTIKDAPNIDEDGHITRGQEDDLYKYYSVDSATVAADNLRTRKWVQGPRGVDMSDTVEAQSMRDERLGHDSGFVDDGITGGKHDVSGYPDAGDGPINDRTRGARPIDNLFDAPDQGNPRPL